jgi:hypothetical protein
VQLLHERLQVPGLVEDREDDGDVRGTGHDGPLETGPRALASGRPGG